MPLKVLTSLLLLISPLLTFAKFSISGKIVDAGDQRTISGATVFLDNASGAATTDKDGAFTLTDVGSGQYQLVVSIIGYDTFKQIIILNGDVTLKEIKITASNSPAKALKSKLDSEWKKNYEVFKSEFLGNDDYAKECDILNPEVIKLRYDRSSISLIGSSSNFIVVENQALGYRIKYLLLGFRKDFEQKHTYYSGPAYFENLSGDASQQVKWKSNRLKAYLGSSTHFLRSSLSNQLAENGFAVRPAVLQVNPLYNEDILRKKYNATLINSVLNANEFMKPTTEPALHALLFQDALYVTYSKEPVQDTVLNQNAPATIVFLNKPYATFDNNGILTDPTAITFDGYWGQIHLADMLPVDYDPNK